MRIALLGDFDTFLFRGLPRPIQQSYYRLSPGLNLARGFCQLGVQDVHYLVVTPEVSKPTVQDGPFGTLHRIPRPPLSGSATFFLWRRHLLHRQLAKLNPDIVHGHGTEQEYGLAAVTSPYRHVVTLHGILHRVHKVMPPPRFSPNHVPRWVEKYVVARARDVICLSRETAEFLRERRSRARCHFVPNAVAPCFFEVQPSPPAEEFRLLFVGSIYPLKGLLQLVDAVAALRGRLARPLRLRIIGATEGTEATQYAHRVRRRAAESGVLEQIDWLGVRFEDGVAAELARAHALVLPSFQETAPMSVAEAMAAGVPVVATRVGGTPDLVEHGVTGLLVAPADVAALAEAIGRLLHDPATRLAMGAAARRKAQAQYTPRVVAEKTLAVYEQILRRPP
jgi:glycosyltransferase involved in cell wall biosynthesis